MCGSYRGACIIQGACHRSTAQGPSLFGDSVISRRGPIRWVGGEVGRREKFRLIQKEAVRGAGWAGSTQEEVKLPCTHCWGRGHILVQALGRGNLVGLMELRKQSVLNRLSRWHSDSRLHSNHHTIVSGSRSWRDSMWSCQGINCATQTSSAGLLATLSET